MDDARAAVAGVDVVVTAGPIVVDPLSLLDASWVEDDVLLLPIDFDFYVSADGVDACDLFLVDEVPQYLSYRDHGYFRSWPDPHASVGDALERDL